MIYANDAQSWLSFNLHWHSRLGECRGDSVDGNWVVGVRSVGADIADDPELAIWTLQALHINKAGDLGHEVYAVDENVTLHNLREWSTFGSLCQIPLQDIFHRGAGS